MQENHLFEYAVIRVVPRVEREEFINVGIILYCAKLKFLEALVDLNEERLLAICKDLNIQELKENLDAFVQISAGNRTCGPISKLDAASRFRWLTATRSTIIQTSKVHPGFCINPAQTLQKLHKQFVL